MDKPLGVPALTRPSLYASPCRAHASRGHPLPEGEGCVFHIPAYTNNPIDDEANPTTSSKSAAFPAEPDSGGVSVSDIQVPILDCPRNEAATDPKSSRHPAMRIPRDAADI